MIFIFLTIDQTELYACDCLITHLLVEWQLVDGRKWKLDDSVFDILSELEILLVQMKDGKDMIMKKRLKTRRNCLAVCSNPR